MEHLRDQLAAELRGMVEEWTDSHLSRERPMEENERDRTEELHATLRAECMEGKALGDWTRWAGRAASFVERYALPITPDSADFRRLCLELGELDTRFYDAVQQRLRGDYSAPWSAAPTAPSAALQAPLPASATPAGMPPERAAMRLSEAVEHYFQFKTHGKAWKDPQRARNNDYGPILRRFVEHFEDKPIGALTRGDVLAYFEKMAACTDRKATTIKLHLERLGSFLRYLKDKLQYPDDLSGSLTLAKAPKSVPYEAFTLDELRALFESEQYRGMEFGKPFQYWVPMLCLYTGARLEEPSSLLLKDIQDRDGHPAYFLSGDGNQGGKNDCAPRWVPVHPALIEAGFLAYVEQVRTEGHDFLFPDIYDNPRHGRTAEPSNYFTEYRRAVGVGAMKGRSTKTAHSFRSTFITAMVEARVDGDVRRLLVGHSAQDTHDETYNQALLWAHCVEGMKAVSFGLQHPPFRDSPAFKSQRMRGAGRLRTQR